VISTPQHLVNEARILIVDDEPANVRLLEIILQQAGYRNVYSTTDARQSLPLYKSIGPDILLLDLTMPYLDGFEVMRLLGTNAQATEAAILVLTADANIATKHRALSAGATDFLTKPFDEIEVLLRIRNLLSASLRRTLLEEMVEERTRDLRFAHFDTLQRLALAAEYRDDATGKHTRRVGVTSRRVADALGLPEAQVEMVGQAAPLHDVGKIAIPDHILLKKGRLTVEEFEAVKRHTTIGARILSGSASPLLRMAEEIALYHHERWDGKGYCGLQGEEIPLPGRIVAVADALDALTHCRPYKKAWPLSAALDEIKQQRGRQFDPMVVDALLAVSESVDLSVDVTVDLNVRLAIEGESRVAAIS